MSKKRDEKLWLRAVGKVLAKGEYSVVEGSVGLSYGMQHINVEDFEMSFSVYTGGDLFKDRVPKEYKRLEKKERV